MKKCIAPSMMCAPLFELKQYVGAFERSGVEYLHIDVMDGCFVPNFTLGTDYCRQLRRLTDIPLDIHLMITEPERKLDWFDVRPGEHVSVHYESTLHIHRALAAIRSKGAKAMVALNPGTPVGVIEDLIPDLDAVLIMAVDPGFAGQKMIPQTLEKIARLRRLLDERGAAHVEIEVDGNVSFENAAKMSAAGADIFVAGTASIFTDRLSPEEAVKQLRRSVLPHTTVTKA